MSNHSFDTEFAARYGIEESIIFGNIYHWCIYNKENKINLQKGKDGVERYYTFNSIASIQSQYNYIALSKVYRVIKRLEDEGLIVTGCFNKRPGDKTRWYSVTEKGEKIYIECCNTTQSKLYSEAEIANCKLQNETQKLQNEMHNLQNETEKLQNKTALPNINKDIDSDVNKNIKTSKSHFSKAEKKSYPQEYYKQVFDAYFTNYSEIWHNSQRYQNEFPEKPVINYKQMSKRIKDAFENYGFEAVLEAVRTSKNHQFLIDSGYVMSFIFGPNELPMLINKNYKNTAQKQNNFSNKKSLEDKIDLSDMAVYEEEVV